MLHIYRICPIKRAVRGGNDRVCVYLPTKNVNMFFTSKNSNLLSGDRHNPGGLTGGRGVKQGSSFDPACFHMCFETYM